MSFADFEHGLTAEEVKRKNQSMVAVDVGRERLKKWRESEHVLNMLRQIKASQEAWNELEMKTWLKATGQI